MRLQNWKLAHVFNKQTSIMLLQHHYASIHHLEVDSKYPLSPHWLPCVHIPFWKGNSYIEVGTFLVRKKVYCLTSSNRLTSCTKVNYTPWGIQWCTLYQSVSQKKLQKARLNTYKTCIDSHAGIEWSGGKRRLCLAPT